MANRSLGYRAPLLWLVLPYALGLAWAKHGAAPPPPSGLALAGVMAVAAWFLAPRHRAGWAGALALAMVLAGTVSYTLSRNRLPAWESLPPREALLTLRITRVFAPTQVDRATGLATITSTDPHLRDLVGQRIYYSLRLRPGERTPWRSAVIRTIGVLERLPRNPPDNTFDGYLADAGMNFRYTRGRILEVVRPAGAYLSFCARTSDRFADMLGVGIEAKQPALTDVLRAMMLGRKHELSDEQDKLFMESGTMHLFAISGLHIGVIALGLQALLLLLRLPRAWRFGLSLAILWLYVDITGGSPSAVRAFCMVAMLQASFMVRVPGNPLAALAASALLVLLVQPMQLFSASFQMSYGIVTALLLLGLPLAETWKQRWPLFADLPQSTWRWWHHRLDGSWRAFLSALAIGLAAILISLPSGVQFFNLFTPGALLANLVLIPIAMFVILAGMGSLLCGLAGFTGGSILCNHAAALILWFIDAGLRQLVEWPGTHHAASFRAPWIGSVCLALALGSLLYGYQTGWANRRGGWWPPFIIVALGLIFGVNFG